jgi:hypothetical protein
MRKSAALLLAFASLAITSVAGASTIQFIGTPTGVNDGSFFVLPYEVTIDGVPQLVTCYDLVDEASSGQVWQADLLTLNQAAVFGYFSGSAQSLANYERVAWLDTQTYNTTTEQIGLQYAIWNVFGTAPQTTESLAYEAAATAAAAGGYAGFDFSGFRFIEVPGGVPGQPGTVQALVYNSPVPEPGGMVLGGLGALLLACGRFGRKRETAPACQ